MTVATRRLLKEQLVVVAVLGSGKKSGAKWHVPHKVNFSMARSLPVEILIPHNVGSYINYLQ